MYIDPILYESRPADSTSREQKEMAVYDLLEQLEIPFIRIDHEVTPSIESCREVEQVLGIEICKNLFLCNRQKTQFYLLMMPGDKSFRTKELSAQINSARLSFAKAEDMEALLGLTPGAVTVLGLMNDRDRRVELLIDDEILRQEYIGCHPCVNTASLKLKTSDVLEKILPYIGHKYRVVKL